MAFERLDLREQNIVLRCMKAVDEFVDDWEKHARLGLEPAELQTVIAMWPQIDDSKASCDGFLAINGCLNEVCHGFHIDPDDWGNWFDMYMSEILQTYRRWKELRETDGGTR